MSQFGQCQEMGGGAGHVEEQQRAADQRPARVDGQRRGVEAPAAGLQGGEHARQEPHRRTGDEDRKSVA